MFCGPLIVLSYYYLVDIVWSVSFRFTLSDNPFGMFKLFWKFHLPSDSSNWEKTYCFLRHGVHLHRQQHPPVVCLTTKVIYSPWEREVNLCFVYNNLCKREFAAFCQANFLFYSAVYVGTAYRSDIPEYSSNLLLALVLLNREFSVLICVRQCLFVCSFCHCLVCHSSFYGFWILLWYLNSLFRCFQRCSRYD